MVKSIHNISESIIAAIFSPVVIDNFRKVIDNKLKKSKIITTKNKQNRER
jgi:dsRNA-specific ribonuclease